MLKVQLLDQITSIVDDFVDVFLGVIFIALFLNNFRDFSVSLFKDIINFILEQVLLISDLIYLDLKVDVLNLFEAGCDLLKYGLDLCNLVRHGNGLLDVELYGILFKYLYITAFDLTICKSLEGLI